METEPNVPWIPRMKWGSGLEVQEGQTRTAAILANLPGPKIGQFTAKVDRRGPDECWEWLGAKHPHGYGIWSVTLGGRKTTTLRPHRVAYVLAHGSIPEGTAIDHLCRNKVCVNPAHLEAVTWKENQQRIPRQPRMERGASINSRKRRDGTTVYRVMFRVNGRQRSRTFDTREAADHFVELIHRVGTVEALGDE